MLDNMQKNIILLLINDDCILLGPIYVFYALSEIIFFSCCVQSAFFSTVFAGVSAEMNRMIQLFSRMIQHVFRMI
jgi:hypothetical protein